MLLDKLESQQEREWYTAAAVEHSLLPHPVNLTAGRTLRAWHEQLRAYFANGFQDRQVYRL